MENGFALTAAGPSGMIAVAMPCVVVALSIVVETGFH